MNQVKLSGLFGALALLVVAPGLAGCSSSSGSSPTHGGSTGSGSSTSTADCKHLAGSAVPMSIDGWDCDAGDAAFSSTSSMPFDCPDGQSKFFLYSVDLDKTTDYVGVPGGRWVLVEGGSGSKTQDQLGKLAGC